MTKFRKIRGHKRIQKDIQEWKNYNLELDLEYLKSSQRNYTKVWVSPFCDISVKDSEIPAPKGKSRKLILEGLLAIFNHWEQQLKTLNQPYYLAIWLYEPNIAKSQVVCAIDGMLDFYDITFFRPKNQLKMPTKNYGNFKKELDTFNWIFAHEENHFTNEDIAETAEIYASKEDYYAFQKWYKRKIKEGARSFTDDYNRTTYSARIGTVWIGTKN